MPRIFIPPGCINGDTAVLPESDARRLLRVLRMGPGDAVTLFDGATEYSSRITSIGTKSAILEILESTVTASEPRLEITLGQGLPKGEKLEWVVQKAVELGVGTVVPVVMDRSVKRPDESGRGVRHDRLARIATEAAQQSGRTRVPEVAAQTGLAGFLDIVADAGLKLVFYEGSKTSSLREILHSANGVKSVAVLVGPEGGLTGDEVMLAVSRGFVAAGIGPRILRTETAGLAALSIIQFELGDIG
ncbi:MAG TPA: 16S rRNA (uracil(1498)-N(3))-methyltransferase [Nitrospirota bacterium]